MANKTAEEISDITSEDDSNNNYIVLNEFYRLNFDKWNIWITEKTLVKPKGKLIQTEEPRYKHERVAGYSSNFKTLLQSFVDNKTRRIEAVEVKEFLEKVAELQEKAKEIARLLGEKLDNKEVRGK